MFNRGDKVVCIDNEDVEDYLTVDKIYEVCEYSEINKVINLLKMDTWYRDWETLRGTCQKMPNMMLPKRRKVCWR